MSRNFSNLGLQTKKYQNLKAMCKVNNIPSEIRNFFKEKRYAASMNDLTILLESLHLSDSNFGGSKRENCKLTNLQVFQILVMMPFFAVRGFSHYATSVMNRMFGGKKDILYSFMSQDSIDWRNIVHRVASSLIKGVTVRKDFKKSHLPPVLIGDDSDLPKTGLRMENIGKIFSHVHQKCILGYKLLMLCWSDGRSQFMMDCSLHGEKGKTDGKEQGLTAEQRRHRYQKRDRDKESPATKRMEEYFMSKGQKLIEMVKGAIKARVSFEYLLVDSWFTCKELVDFVCKCHRRFHLLGMAKLGNTKYKTKEWGELTAKAMLAKLQSAKSIKYSRRCRCHHACITVSLGNRDVKLFFCRQGKSEKWRLLLTTDTSLDFLRAYEIYSMRWAIEVFFADSKRLLGLADCSARDFTSQIAHVSLVMIRYNLLALIKRANDYETMGGLFADIYSGVKELTVIEKIWDIILEVVAVVAEMIGIDDEIMIEQIIENNERLAVFHQLAKTA